MEGQGQPGGGQVRSHPGSAQSVECLVQLRAHGDVHGCTAWLDGDAVRIRLHRPARGVAKGQAAVLYDGDTVLAARPSAARRRRPVASGSRPGRYLRT